MKYTEKQTLAEKTAQNLLEMIQEKGYGAGDKLPTEAELVETLGVGRNTVREALRILMSRNIVTIRQGSGTFISDKNGVADDPLGFFMMDDRRQLTEDLHPGKTDPGTGTCSACSPEWFRRRNQRTGIHFKRTGRTDPG